MRRFTKFQSFFLSSGQWLTAMYPKNEPHQYFGFNADVTNELIIIISTQPGSAIVLRHPLSLASRGWSSEVPKSKAYYKRALTRSVRRVTKISTGSSNKGINRLRVSNMRPLGSHSDATER